MDSPEGLRTRTRLRHHPSGHVRLCNRQVRAGEVLRLRQREMVGNPPAQRTVEIQEGDYNPAAGLSFLQIGRAGLNFQKSQNGGVAMPSPGAFTSPYHRYGSRVPAGAQGTIVLRRHGRDDPGIATLTKEQPDFLKSGLTEIAADVQKAVAGYRPERPTASPRLWQQDWQEPSRCSVNYAAAVWRNQAAATPSSNSNKSRCSSAKP